MEPVKTVVLNSAIRIQNVTFNNSGNRLLPIDYLNVILTGLSTGLSVWNLSRATRHGPRPFHPPHRKGVAESLVSHIITAGAQFCVNLLAT